MRDGQAEPVGQILDRFGKRQTVVFHQEAERRAMHAAAEAVIKLLVGADPERSCLLVVERAAGLVFAPGALQWHAAADDLHDIGAGDQLVDEGLRNPTGHTGR